MKEILLNQGYKTLVDDVWYECLKQLNWFICPEGKSGKQRVRSNYYINHKKGSSIYMHRFIMNAKHGEEIDHINGNPLDNRVCNLRKCSHNDNVRNTNKINKKSTIYKGVSFDKKHNKFECYIHYLDKKYFLGYYKTQIEAAKKYDQFARYFFGKFANLNIKEELSTRFPG